MTRLLAFDQIELLLGELEKFWIDHTVYKSRAESLTPSAELAETLQAAREDPLKLADVQQRFGPVRQQLREMAESLLTLDALQDSPPKGQSN